MVLFNPSFDATEASHKEQWAAVKSCARGPISQIWSQANGQKLPGCRTDLLYVISSVRVA